MISSAIIFGNSWVKRFFGIVLEDERKILKNLVGNLHEICTKSVGYGNLMGLKESSTYWFGVRGRNLTNFFIKFRYKRSEGKKSRILSYVMWLLINYKILKGLNDKIMARVDRRKLHLHLNIQSKSLNSR